MAAKLSPMMRQYFELKKQNPDTLLFFRLGDFYEMFFDDAITASRELDLTLTGRDCGLAERAPMCGVPYHAVDTYLNRLMEKGYKVAICEQLTDPAESKGLVERGIVRIVTPGTVIESTLLDERSNNYLLALSLAQKVMGFAYVDVSTSEFRVTQIDLSESRQSLLDELVRLNPAEIIADPNALSLFREDAVLAKAVSVEPYHYQTQAWDRAEAAHTITQHFSQSLTQLGINELPQGICAVGALLQYLYDMQKNALQQHLKHLYVYSIQDTMMIDAATRQSLELTRTLRSHQRKGTLLWLLDRAKTAMGSRLLRRWLEQPLQKKREIDARLDAVEELMGDLPRKQFIQDELGEIKDIERIITRISYETITARDCLALQQSIAVLPDLLKHLATVQTPLLKNIIKDLDPLSDIHDLLSRSIADEPAVGIRDGNIIRDGYHEELDSLRNAARNGRELIAQMEAAEREATGIKNLRISYNRVFGYYIEVSKSNLDAVPYRYTRKQTLSTGERYITEELKELENTILGADERSVKLEYQLFVEIRKALDAQVPRLQKVASLLAQLDALLSLATSAQENRFTKPAITEDGSLDIVEGRHPVVERSLPGGEHFVPNGTQMNMTDHRFLIITGPNMAGKSTYLRQVALITIMAHMGSFVPAHSARIPITDRVFARVGASDDLFSGQSTFMVEMLELSNILRNATANSLIILDEIGRGTSTYDGLSIAWAVIEYICNRKILGSKTLFATHYHELCELEGRVAGVCNYCVSVTEMQGEVVFLRRIVRGGSDRSFGIHVAQMAGLPEEVLTRAQTILERLEDANLQQESLIASAQEAGEALNRKEDYKAQQLGLSALLPYNDVLEEIRAMDMQTTTPIDAFYILNRLKEKMK